MLKSLVRPIFLSRLHHPRVSRLSVRVPTSKTTDGTIDGNETSNAAVISFVLENYPGDLRAAVIACGGMLDPPITEAAGAGSGVSAVEQAGLDGAGVCPCIK